MTDALSAELLRIYDAVAGYFTVGVIAIMGCIVVWLLFRDAKP